MGKVYTKSGDKWNEAKNKVYRIQRLIKEAEIKKMVNQPVDVGEWRTHRDNNDVFLRVNRFLIDGSLELFMVNIHNRMPNLSLLEMSRKEFFETCCKINRPPVNKIMGKIKEFING